MSNNTYQDKEPDKCNFFDRACLSDWRWSFCPFQHLKPDTSVIFFKKISFVLLIENIFFKFICKSSLSIPFSLTIQLIRNNHAENTILGIFEIRQSRFLVVYHKSISYKSTCEKLWHFHIYQILDITNYRLSCNVHRSSNARKVYITLIFFSLQFDWRKIEIIFLFSHTIFKKNNVHLVLACVTNYRMYNLNVSILMICLFCLFWKQLLSVPWNRDSNIRIELSYYW